MRVTRAPSLSDKLGRVLTEVLTLLQRREDLKAVDDVTEAQSLVAEYSAKVEADRRALDQRIADEEARKSAESTIMWRADARSEQLQEEYGQISSLILETEETIVRVEAELE